MQTIPENQKYSMKQMERKVAKIEGMDEGIETDRENRSKWRGQMHYQINIYLSKCKTHTQKNPLNIHNVSEKKEFW